jgi:hypothetical protein
MNRLLRSLIVFIVLAGCEQPSEPTQASPRPLPEPAPAPLPAPAPAPSPVPGLVPLKINLDRVSAYEVDTCAQAIPDAIKLVGFGAGALMHGKQGQDLVEIGFEAFEAVAKLDAADERKQEFCRKLLNELNSD